MTLKDAVVALLFVVGVLGWFATWDFFQKNQSDIVLAFEQVVSDIAFPFRVAALRQQPIMQRIPVPVYGVLSEAVEDTWGDARSEGRTHEGTDIFADEGTPVFSATEGYVYWTDFGYRGGRNVIIEGPGGMYYYYAHFTRPAVGIREGVWVDRDTVLGFVGTTGNAQGTPPHLHFGMYIKQWEPINPYAYLVGK